MKEGGTLGGSVLTDIELMLNCCIKWKGCLDFVDTSVVGNFNSVLCPRVYAREGWG